MFRTYNFKQRAMPFLILAFVMLAPAMMARPANAQAITTLGQVKALILNGDFQIDTLGFGSNYTSDHLFRITAFDPTMPSSSECPSPSCSAATFRAYYGPYASSSRRNNAHGTLTVTSNRQGRITVISTKITFTTDAQVGDRIVTSATDFDGAIRFPGISTKEHILIAGTFSYYDLNVGTRGPFPFYGFYL